MGDDERTLLLPGQPLPFPHGAKVTPGAGTYARDGYIVASRVGYSEGGLAGVPSSAHTTASVVGTQVPLILGRVTRVTPRQATVSILVVDGLPCGGAQATSSGTRSNHAAGEGIDGSDFQGIVRAQDVRTTEKDSVVLSECFRPGDIIRAAVISLGDARSYYLSTARNDLGVVHATGGAATQYGWAPARHSLQPLSWREMVDPATGRTEKRKCAKPAWL
ncbi:exosome protein [Malassezia pachydermatis]